MFIFKIKMENTGKKIRENFVLADMHCNGVYFDKKILGAYKMKSAEVISGKKENNQA
ncbi:hypothetical protein ML462_11795 [Gramella lutea]|uniref:Uncharacterized protein n=1 Tax=Christiangramia lutea TaxID=1607951 RepID=A0A9X2A9R4_9FLAO|nr:hypothetical protein [Christiangramia lutea]MCH4823854.1 hypothetical protein [Christiangramia lutea]